MNRTSIEWYAAWQFWRLLCWLAPVSWWFKRLRYPRLADLYIWLNAKRWYAKEALEGRCPQERWPIHMAITDADKLECGLLWDQRPEGWG